MRRLLLALPVVAILFAGCSSGDDNSDTDEACSAIARQVGIDTLRRYDGDLTQADLDIEIAMWHDLCPS